MWGIGMHSNVQEAVHSDAALEQPVSWSLFLDIAERVFVVMACGWLVYRFLPTLHAHPFGMLLLLSEALALFFIVIRKTGQSADTLNAWAIAIAGTFLPTLVIPVGQEIIPLPIASALMITGLFLSVSAKAFLQRSFGIVAANRGVKYRGPYRLVRHPMYLGYLLSHAAFLGTSFSMWNVLVYTGCWLAMILRIAAEEGVLELDPRYLAYRAKVRWRLIPGLW